MFYVCVCLLRVVVAVVVVVREGVGMAGFHPVLFLSTVSLSCEDKDRSIHPSLTHSSCNTASDDSRKTYAAE